MVEWQPIKTVPHIPGKQVLLGCEGYGAVLAEWANDGWVETLGGEFYGTAIGFEPTHWCEVTSVPEKGLIGGEEE